MNRLGHSPLLVSEIGLGCMSLPPSVEGERIIHAALDYGIAFFDTADLYGQGQNEELLGRALKGRRGQVVLATKVGHLFLPGTSAYSWGPSKAQILKAVKDSLRRLQTEYIDVYQLHGGTADDPFTEIVEAFEALKEQGCIRAYGISSIRPQVIRHYVETTGIDSVMMQYSVLDRRPEEQVLNLLQQAGVSVIARGPLARGLLAGRSASDDPYLDYDAEELRATLHSLHAIAGAGRTLGQLAIRYALAHPTVATVVPGASTLAQLVTTMSVLSMPSLSTEEMAEIKQVTKVNVYKAFR